MIEQMKTMHKKPSRRDNENNKQTQFQKKKKYCNLHKTNSHDDYECNAQKHSTNNRSNNMTIKEPKTLNKLIELNLTIENNKARALLDTGSTFNF